MQKAGRAISLNFGEKPAWLISDEESAAVDKAENERKAAEKIAKSGIPERYVNARLEDCTAEVIQYALSRGRTWLILSGKNGTGKTYQACAVATYIIRKELCNAKFASMGKILGDIRDTYATRESAESVFGKYANCRLLVIDDFCKEKPTEANVAMFFRIVNARYEKQLATIFTTNLSTNEMLESLVVNGNSQSAMAIIDRMADSENTFVRLSGGSRRRAAV